MPEIEVRGDNWYISHHQEGYIEVLEAALPSNRRIRLEYIDGGQDVVLKVLTRNEDASEKWTALTEMEYQDLNGIAGLFMRASDMIQIQDETKEEEARGWRPWRWFRRPTTGKGRRRDDVEGEDPFAAFGGLAGDTGIEQGDDGVPANDGGGGGDPQDERATSGDGPEDS